MRRIHLALIVFVTHASAGCAQPPSPSRGAQAAEDQAPGTTPAIEYFISPSGNDANNGLSPARAWRNPSRANTVKPHRAGPVRIRIAGGTYRDREHLRPRFGGTSITSGAYTLTPAAAAARADQQRTMLIESADVSAIMKQAESLQRLDIATLKPGDVLEGRYKYIERIGRGAFGTVLLMEDTVVDERLILKFLNPSIANDEEMMQRFVHEPAHPLAPCDLEDGGLDRELLERRDGARFTLCFRRAVQQPIDQPRRPIAHRFDGVDERCHERDLLA